MEGDVVTEVPSSLKRLVRLVIRGFYTIDHVIVVDMLIRNPCVKEDDLADFLKFEKKQLRSVVAQLKNDRFVKVRLRMETGPDGKATRQNYYYINYKVFVNVVKYKLDHMRRKIETEERDSTSRASFRCTVCSKTFTDLEADQLVDLTTGEFRCSYCSAPVEEDESATPRQDSRLLLARFNEQIEPLYVLLREVEDIKLAAELLEPDPTDLSHMRKDQKGSTKPRDGVWSGEATRNQVKESITVSVADNAPTAVPQAEKKETPVWLAKSTVLQQEAPVTMKEELPSVDTKTSTEPHSDILEALLAHEKREAPKVPGESSDSEESVVEATPEAAAPDGVTEGIMESGDSDDEGSWVQVAGRKVAVHEVTEELVAQMTPAEKEDYIRLRQELYSMMYE
ncbi:general transcription factor IIE subunit 1-like [Ornithodoros turicata]|uniref:general transcription factor IIE subunit 1-like n=1 Tax=Ornithodoros turicata TaxID=34597 RepID=UPI003139B214